MEINSNNSIDLSLFVLLENTDFMEKNEIHLCIVAGGGGGSAPCSSSNGGHCDSLVGMSTFSFFL